MSSIMPKLTGDMATASVDLHAVTRQRLSEFQRRRGLLELARGLAWSVVFAVASLLLAILIDWFFPFEIARWLGSSTFYAATLGAFAVGCLRPWLARHSLKDEARHFEHLEPRLREQLLAAVELAEQPGRSDSTAFRAALQSKVAELIGAINPATALPLKRNRQSLQWAAGTLAVLLVLGMLPQLHFGWRLARVLLPLADIGRVTSVVISIEQPTPPEKTVAEGMLVAVQARLSATDDEAVVVLETRAPGEQQTQAMVKVVSNADQPLYAGSIETNGEWIEYRVRAGEAQTRWHRLTIRQPPSLQKVYKTIRLPEYAGQPNVELIEDHGDVTTWIGSKAKLEFEFNEPEANATLRWIAGPSSELDGKSMPLTKDPVNGRASIEFLVSQSADYRVDLVSPATGLENAFSSTYHIEGLDDRPVKLTWLQPNTPKRIVGIDELVLLSIQVNDEWPVGKLSYQSRVRRGSVVDDWQVRDVPQAESSIAAIFDATWDLDLRELGIASGETLDVQVVAIDRKGQATESSMVQLVVSATSIDVPPSQGQLARSALADQLDELATALEVADKKLVDLQQAGDEANGESSEVEPADGTTSIADRESMSQQVAAQTREVAEELAKRGSELQTQLRQTLNAQQMAVDEHELRTLGNSLSQLATTEPVALNTAIESLLNAEVQDGLNSEQSAEENRRTTANAIERTRQSIARAREAATAARDLSSYDEIERRAQQASRLAEAYSALHEAAINEEANIDQLSRQAEVLGRQLQEWQAELSRPSSSVREQTNTSLQTAARELNWVIEQATKAGESNDPRSLAETSKFVANSLEQSRVLQRLDHSLPDALRDSQRRLKERALDADDIVEQMASGGASATPQQTAALLEHMENERENQRSGGHTDAQAGSDLGLVRRAALEVQSTSGMSESERKQSLSEVRDATRQLLAASTLNQAAMLLSELQRAEQWQRDPALIRTEHPKEWRAYEQQLDVVSQAFRQANLPQDMLSQIDQLRWNDSANRAGQKLGERTWRAEATVSAATDLLELTEQMRNVQADVATYAEQARKQLAEAGPTLGELADRAADAAEQLQSQTNQLAAEQKRGEVPEPQVRIDALEQNWQANNQPLNELQNALIDLADSQNLLEKSGVETAREVDQALELTRQAETQIDRSIEQLESPTPSANSQSALADRMQQSAEMQADASEALREIAKHFSAPEQARQLSHEERLAQLDEIGGQLQEPSQADQTSSSDAYTQAERLARLAEADPREAIRQLERRLQTSPPMQEELSAISAAAANQALETLDQAQELQEQLVGEVEQSDPTVAAKRELLEHDLSIASEASQQVARNIIDRAAEAAQRGESAEAERLSSLAQDLDAAREKLQDTNHASSFDEMREKAAELAEALKTGAEQLARASQSLGEVVPIHENAADLNNRRQDMRDWQRRVQQQMVRDAQQLERQTQQGVREAESRLRQTEQQRRDKENQVQQSQRELDRQPDQQWLQDQLISQRQELALADQQVQAAEQLKSSLEERLKLASEATAELNSLESPSLNSLNPSTELASNLAGQAQEQLSGLANSLQQNWQAQEPQAAAAKRQLGDAIRTEDHIEHDAQNAADTLSRAARHEERLRNTTAAQTLDGLAKGTTQVVEQEVAEADNALSSAQAEATAEQAATGQASVARTATAMEQIQAAASALENSADDLRSFLDSYANVESGAQSTATPQQQASQAGASSGSGSQASQDNNSVLQPREMAQLLDELDRQQFARQSTSSNQSNAQNENAPPNGGTPQGNRSGQPAQTLAEAARRLATSLSQNRQSNSRAPSTQPGQSSREGESMQAQRANPQPQPPVAARVVDVDRLGDDWGKLREQAADEVVQSRRDSMPPHIRRQVDAYFRSLGSMGSGETTPANQ